MRIIVLKKSALLSFAALLLAFALCLTGVHYTNTASVFLGKSPRLIPIYRVGTEERVIALTFNAWADDTNDGKILELLQEYGVAATYFVSGIYAERNPETLKKLSEYLEIGTLGNTHCNMSSLNKAQVSLEVETSLGMISAVTGKTPDLLRPPFGQYGDTMLNEAKRLNMFTVCYDVEIRASDNNSAAVKRVLSGAGCGSIIYIPNEHKDIAAVLPIIIQGLKDRGFNFKTIGEMIYKTDYIIDSSGRQIKGE